MNFVSAWKAGSIVLTGAFGVLGLLTEFKDKDKKITGWGKVSLVGILASTFLGVFAQVKETQNDSAKALALARDSNVALHEIERGLYQFDDPRIHLTLLMKCKPQNQAICNDVAALPHEGNSVPSQRELIKGLEQTEFQVGFYRHNEKNDERREYETDPGDLAYSMKYGENMAMISPQQGQPKDIAIIETYSFDPLPFENNGRVRSILDLPNSTVVIQGSGLSFYDLELGIFQLGFRGGQQILLTKSELNKRSKMIKIANLTSTAGPIAAIEFPITSGDVGDLTPRSGETSAAQSPTERGSDATKPDHH